jgi:hypothetical protein
MDLTNSQIDTIALLRRRGYPTLGKRGTASGALVVRVARRMRRGYMSLTIAPDGAYKTTDPAIRFADIRRK